MQGVCDRRLSRKEEQRKTKDCEVMKSMEHGYYNMDCMEGMRQFPDNYFSLAIVDPPYFSGPNKRGYYGHRVSPIGVDRVYEKTDDWDVPDKTYFGELMRVSKNQIIWGCNYFLYPFGSGRIVWDKCNDSSSYSDCEIAYCSMQNSVRIFRFMWSGMLQGKSITEGYIQQGNKKLNEKRIHPTQKPVALYEWILQKYAKQGDIILDTHVGSASSLIACHRMGFEYVGFEKNPKHYKNSLERLEQEKSQSTLFDFGMERIELRGNDYE